MSGRPDAYELLKRIVDLSASPLPIEAKLNHMLLSLSAMFPCDRALLLKPDQMGEQGLLSRVASERKPLWVGEGSSFEKENILPEEASLLVPSFVCFPLHDGASFQGILYLGFLKGQRFLPEEVDLLLSISKEMEGAIRQANLLLRTEQVHSKLAVLHQLGKALTSTLKLEDLLESIVMTGANVLKAKGGVLRLEDKKTKELKVKQSLGDYHQHPLDEKLSRRVFFSRTPVSLHHLGEERASPSVLCAPLVSKGRVIGTLAFYDKEGLPTKFDEEDFQLFLTMATQISCSIENALIHYETSMIARELEKRVRQLSTLWELSKALLTTVHFERTLHMTLTAVTLGEGLGFNRAMLFMVNEKEHTVEGKMAVGPDSVEDAWRIWESLSTRRGSPSDLITQLQPSPQDNSVLNAVVKGIKIPLEQDPCILVRTVLEGKPFNIQLPQSREGWLQTGCERGCRLSSEVGCYVGEHLSRDPKVYSFATIPVWGKGKVIGVILVDNLYNQNPISEEDVHYLSMFSHQAGMAIENAALYRNLEEVHRELKETQSLLVHREKMVALGELAANVAHQIRNPLVSIGGFARRLYRAIPNDAPERRYTQSIIIEVGRLESILNNLLNYTREKPPVLKQLDVRDLLEESLAMASEGFSNGGIQVVREYTDSLPMVNGDYQQLRQAFCNLIDNAFQAMNEKGILFLRVRPLSQNGSSFVRVEVEDTGKGITPENLHNIFNPFYTSKASGLGLGLPIVHKIVTSHRGQIEVENRSGKGLVFIITLPAIEERKEKSKGLA